MVFAEIAGFPVLQELYSRVTESPNRVAQFVKMIDEHGNRERETYSMWDQLAAACVIDETVICETKKICASVELCGSDNRGRMVVDSNRTSGKTENVHVVTRINRSLYEKLYMAAFSFL